MKKLFLVGSLIFIIFGGTLFGGAFLGSMEIAENYGSVYEGSQMHFDVSVADNKLKSECSNNPRDKLYEPTKKPTLSYSIPYGYPWDNLTITNDDNNITGIGHMRGDMIEEFYNYYDSLVQRGIVRQLYTEEYPVGRSYGLKRIDNPLSGHFYRTVFYTIYGNVFWNEHQVVVVYSYPGKCNLDHCAIEHECGSPCCPCENCGCKAILIITHNIEPLHSTMNGRVDTAGIIERECPEQLIVDDPHTIGLEEDDISMIYHKPWKEIGPEYDTCKYIYNTKGLEDNPYWIWLHKNGLQTFRELRVFNLGGKISSVQMPEYYLEMYYDPNFFWEKEYRPNKTNPKGIPKEDDLKNQKWGELDSSGRDYKGRNLVTRFATILRAYYAMPDPETNTPPPFSHYPRQNASDTDTKGLLKRDKDHTYKNDIEMWVKTKTLSSATLIVQCKRCSNCDTCENCTTCEDCNFSITVHRWKGDFDECIIHDCEHNCKWMEEHAAQLGAKDLITWFQPIGTDGCGGKVIGDCEHWKHFIINTNWIDGHPEEDDIPLHWSRDEATGTIPQGKGYFDHLKPFPWFYAIHVYQKGGRYWWTNKLEELGYSIPSDKKNEFIRDRTLKYMRKIFEEEYYQKEYRVGDEIKTEYAEDWIDPELLKDEQSLWKNITPDFSNIFMLNLTRHYEFDPTKLKNLFPEAPKGNPEYHRAFPATDWYYPFPNGGDSDGGGGLLPPDFTITPPMIDPICIVSGFGWRIHPITGNWSFHTGVDIVHSPDPSDPGYEPCGEPVFAAHDGTVVFAGYTPGYGFLVIIKNGIVETYYAHLSEIEVTTGQNVKAGDEIGKVGSTGTSTGCHLHFEIRVYGTPIDPAPYLPDVCNP